MNSWYIGEMFENHCINLLYKGSADNGNRFLYTYNDNGIIKIIEKNDIRGQDIREYDLYAQRLRGIDAAKILVTVWDDSLNLPYIRETSNLENFLDAYSINPGRL